MSEKNPEPDKHQTSGNSQSKVLDDASISEITEFKTKMEEMRVYFSHGTNYDEIGQQELSSFENEIRAFIAKIDEWQKQQMVLDSVFNTPGEIIIKLQEIRKITFRAKNLLRKKSRTEKEDNELIGKYEYLPELCSIIFEKILVTTDNE